MHIHITGASGSGTSTLGRAVAEYLGFAHFDADDYYWMPTIPPFVTKRAKSDRLTLLLSDMRSAGSSVVSGSVLDWGSELENVFSLVVFLYLETSIRVERLRRREVDKYGITDLDFLEWASLYDAGPPSGRSLAKHQAWLAARECPKLELHGDLSVVARTRAVLDKMNVLFHPWTAPLQNAPDKPCNLP